VAIFTLLPFLAVHVPNEPELVRRLIEGDSKALGEVYDWYGLSVYRVVLRMIDDPGVAEELVQDTFLRFWNRAHLLQPESSLGPWIATIARNRAIDYLRSTGGRIANHQSNIETIEHSTIFVTTHAEFVNSPQAREMKQAVEKLNGNQREAIELAYYQGLSHTEIAAKMNQPLGTVKSWIRNALRTLRSELEEVKHA